MTDNTSEICHTNVRLTSSYLFGRRDKLEIRLGDNVAFENDDEIDSRRRDSISDVAAMKRDRTKWNNEIVKGEIDDVESRM